MKNNKNKILAAVVLILMVVPFLVLADTPGGAELPNPLGTSDVSTLVARIINIILGLVGVLALVMFIYGGIMWMTSGGNEQKIKKGKDTLVWATLGLAIIFFSYAMVNFVLETILTKITK